MSNEQHSAVIILKNLIKFVDINKQRLADGKSTICKTAEGETIRNYLPCSNTNPDGSYVIKCEDCPFSSVEAAEETIAELEVIVKKQKLKELLLGIKSD
jgi:hypothetical protein